MSLICPNVEVYVSVEVNVFVFRCWSPVNALFRGKMSLVKHDSHLIAELGVTHENMKQGICCKDHFRIRMFRVDQVQRHKT